jgi:alpha-mannosidase
MDHPTKESSNTNGATKTIIIEQSAHCDWDWVNTFLAYYTGNPPIHAAVEQTLKTAISLMTHNNQPSPPPLYFYSFCEMAYLKEFVKKNPDQINNIKSVASFFSLSSGGITSADNLLSHGEAFIRNYLLGRYWATQELGITPTNQMWIPDDFGHDAQLPIVLQAMGFMGVGFWRIGGNQPDIDPSSVPTDAPYSILMNSVGLDFIWQAQDQSRVQVHFLSKSYCEGNSFCNVQGNTSGVCHDNTIPWDGNAQSTINQFFLDNLSPKNLPTPYLFVPVDCDFCAPYANLAVIINNWNQCNQNANCPSPQPGGFSGYVAEMGSFDKFMRLVQEYTAPGNPNDAALTVCYSNPTSDDETLFLPNPFYAGSYGSRPELKSLHYETTRTLLLAETMEIIFEYLAFTNASKWSPIAAKARTLLAEAWLKLVPSTHHDYVTGTASDTVYASPPPNGEQLYDLQKALKGAKELSTKILQKIAGAAPPSTTSGVTTVLVFNSLGLGRAGVVEIRSPGEGLVSATVNNEDYFPVQYLKDSHGNPALLFMANDPSTNTGVPSLGYSTVFLSDHEQTITPHLSLKPSSDESGSYVMTNEFIRAVISPQGISELYDLVNDPTKEHNLLGTGGGQIVFYNDSGNIYRFGNELPETNPTFSLDTSLKLDSQSMSMAETGHLRCTLTAPSTIVVDNNTIDFTTNYTLIAGEPFLRIKITGTAPSGYSVMAKFSFASQISTLTYGTPYHWDTRGPRNYIGFPTASETNVEGMTFEPTHEFVIPTDSDGNYLAAIYHASTPGWAIDSTGALLGCILRNTPGGGNAISGTDSGTHTASLALRVAGKPDTATQLLSPAVGCNPGGPLGEALQFNNPLVGCVVPATSSVELLNTMSIAATSDPTAVITAAKAGTLNPSDLILRVYQPTNSPMLGLEVNMDIQISKMYQGETLNVVGQTALETSLDGENLSPTATETSFTFTAPFAITTLALSPD